MNGIQQRVQEAIDKLVASGADRGLQVAVYRYGESVVDAVAGIADPATGVAFALTKNRLTPGFDAAERVAGIVSDAVASGGSGAPESDLPTWLSKPARRALASAGYARLEGLAEVSEAEIMKLHGIGPGALDHLRRALAAWDQRFAGP